MNQINICKKKEEYFKEFNGINGNKNSTPFPIYINSRPDIEKKATYINTIDITVTDIFKSDYGVIISKEVELYQNSNLFCKKWSSPQQIEHDKILCETLVIIGLYKDFTQKKVLSLINYCYKNNIEMYFLIGRDLSSLSWLIGKQFFKNSVAWQKEGIFSLLNLKKFSNTNREIFDNKDLKNKDIKKILENNNWKQLIFHGHGKEDHLNLDDFTLTGVNESIKAKTPFAPSIGHAGQSFFKDISKAIPISNLKAKQLFFLSCNNFPFYDSRLYDTKFNLVLNAIDGWVSQIIASISVQSADSPEIELLINHSDDYNIGLELNRSLQDIQAIVSIITIGLPDLKSKKTQINEIDSASYRLTPTTCNILDRLVNYSSSTMLDESHPIKRMAQKTYSDYMPATRRGRSGLTIETAKKFEEELINRVNPFSKKIGEIMFEDQNDRLHEFDGFNTYRSIIKEDSIYQEKCSSCNGMATHCTYIPQLSSLFNIEATYCYKCGDKSAAMTNMPKIIFSCDEFNTKSLQIHYRIKLTSREKGDVFYGVQLPSYIEKSVKTKLKLQKIKFKSKDITRDVEGIIEFKSNTILQSYYLKLFVVQNGGIAIDRCFFNLI